MENELVDRLELLLKEEGFRHVSKQGSVHSATLSGDRGPTRILIHVTDQEELPHQSGRNEEGPAPSEIRITARPPLARNLALGEVPQRSGQGGALRRSERLKRR